MIPVSYPLADRKKIVELQLQQITKTPTGYIHKFDPKGRETKKHKPAKNRKPQCKLSRERMSELKDRMIFLKKNGHQRDDICKIIKDEFIDDNGRKFENRTLARFYRQYVTGCQNTLIAKSMLENGESIKDVRDFLCTKVSKYRAYEIARSLVGGTTRGMLMRSVVDLLRSGESSEKIIKETGCSKAYLVTLKSKLKHGRIKC